MNRLHITKLTSIGAVPEGDNPEASIMFWKRKVSTDERERLAERGAALPDGSFPIATTGDLANAIQAYGRAKNKTAAKAHIIRRARALGATDRLPAEWTEKNAESVPTTKEGQQMTKPDLTGLDPGVLEYVQSLEAQVQPAEPALPDDLPEPVQKALADKDDVIAKERAEREALAKQVQAMRDEQMTERYTKRASELVGILGSDPEVPQVLKGLAMAAPEPFAKLDALLSQAARIAQEHDTLLFKELGSTEGDADPIAKIEAIAKEIHKEERDQFPTFVEAKAEAWARNPDLRDALRGR